MSGSQSANKYTSVLRKSKDNGDPYRTSLKLSRDDDKESFTSHLFIQKPIIHNHEIKLSWQEVCAMFGAANIPAPDYNSNYFETARRLGNFFRFWGRNNLDIGLAFNVYGSPYDPRMQIFFQKKSDLMKWKLAWHGL